MTSDSTESKRTLSNQNEARQTIDGMNIEQYLEPLRR